MTEHRRRRRPDSDDSLTLQLRVAPGKTTRTERMVQRQAGASAAGDDVQGRADAGVAGAGERLPFLDVISQAFGPHDVSGVRAHTDERAQTAAASIGARAYATGDDVAFAGAPDLHTAAHEAAHVVQQRAGVHLAGGVGTEGDVYERQADAVADRVVAGASAADLLGSAPATSGGRPAVQRLVEPGQEPGATVFVIMGNGSFEQGTIVEEVEGKGYMVKLATGPDLIPYARLDLHDPRAVDATLGKDKWKEVVRGDHHHMGPKAYDREGTEFGRTLKPGTSYSKSMEHAQGLVTDTLGVPLSPEYIQHVHTLGTQHMSRTPELRNERSGNGYDGSIGIGLLDQHVDPGGPEELAAETGQPMRYYGPRVDERTGQNEHRLGTSKLSSKEVVALLQGAIDVFQEALGHAMVNDEVLTAIAVFTQSLARLHPFEDANTRTNMVLLNKLLVENGFTPAIMADPKHFYLSSLKSWKARIAQGMERWSKEAGVVTVDVPSMVRVGAQSSAHEKADDLVEEHKAPADVRAVGESPEAIARMAAVVWEEAAGGCADVAEISLNYWHGDFRAHGVTEANWPAVLDYIDTHLIGQGAAAQQGGVAQGGVAQGGAADDSEEEDFT